MVCTHVSFRVRSRRGWDMTALLPELASAVPAGVQLDGELVALDSPADPTSACSARGCCTGSGTGGDAVRVRCARR